MNTERDIQLLIPSISHSVCVCRRVVLGSLCVGGVGRFCPPHRLHV